jgi:hypothetical protein
MTAYPPVRKLPGPRVNVAFGAFLPVALACTERLLRVGLPSWGEAVKVWNDAKPPSDTQ